MAGQIRITPEELRDAATFLDNSRAEIGEKVKGVDGKIDQIAEGWEGAAKSTFIDGFKNDMLPMLTNDFPSILEGVSQQLRGAADAIEQADQEVANAFKG